MEKRDTVKIAREAAQFLIDQLSIIYLKLHIESMLDFEDWKICRYVMCPPGISSAAIEKCRYCPLRRVC